MFLQWQLQKLVTTQVTFSFSSAFFLVNSKIVYSTGQMKVDSFESKLNPHCFWESRIEFQVSRLSNNFLRKQYYFYLEYVTIVPLSMGLPLFM